MADTIWPASLPTKPLLGFTEVQAENTIRSKTESGPAKVRRRFTSVPVDFEMVFVLSAADMAVLSSFYETTTKHGSLTFSNLPHPRTDADKTWRFKKPPKITSVDSDVYETTLELEVIPF